jgi:hypothetical protein
MNRSLLGALTLLALAASSGCALDGDDDESVLHPTDVEGTWQTAAALKLAACASVYPGAGYVTMMLSPQGTCDDVPAHVKTCRKYSDLSLIVNGRTFENKRAGGWAYMPTKREDGVEAYACYFPSIDLDLPDLSSESGTLDIRMRIGNEDRAFTIEDSLAPRTLSLSSGILVPGSVAVIEAGSRLAAGDATKEELTLLDEQRDVAATWEPIPWNGSQIELPVPDTLPPGEAFLELSESGTVNVAACPFASCMATIARSSTLRVTIAAP